jgi:RluA family pseudouridine synthase
MQFDAHAMVLWVDDALLVVNKPAGLPSLPDGYHPGAPHLRAVLEPLYGRLWIVHRLDKDTSGVILLARTAPAHRLLNTQFQEHRTGKLYHALVTGVPEWEEQRVDAPLLPDGDRRHRTLVDLQRGKPAVTHFCVLERFSGSALLEAAPETGRPHQIRAHLAYLGYPLLADKLYSSQGPNWVAGQPDRPPLIRLALHAWSLEIEHPLDGERRTYTAHYPEDFRAALEQLRQFSSQH